MPVALFLDLPNQSLGVGYELMYFEKIPQALLMCTPN